MKNFVILFLALCFNGHAQSRWDFQQCITYALTHNNSLKQSSLNNEINKNNATQTRAGALPSLNAGATHIYNIGKTIDRFTNSFANDQVLSQNFYLTSNVVLWSCFSQ